MKIPSLFLIIFITLSLCACENHWMKEIFQTVTVTFDADGGIPVPEKQILYNGAKVKRPQNDPIKGEATPTDDGSVPMIFYGWYKYKQDKQYGPNGIPPDEETNKLYDFNFVPISDMTLYAWWGKSTININFDTDGGLPVPNPKILYKGQKVEEPEGNTPWRQDSPNNFVGWYTDVYYKKYIPDDPASNEVTIDKEKSKLYNFGFLPFYDMTLYAGWENLK